MYSWVIKIAAAAVVMTAAGYILPKGNIKKAAMLAFGFLFLTTLLLPLKSFTSELLEGKAALALEKNTLLAQAEDSGMEKQIMEQYKERLGEEIASTLEQQSIFCSNLSITVDEDIESETFGYVLSVSCSISGAGESAQNTIEKIRVPEIVIDLNGIRVEDANENASEQDAAQKEMERQAAAVIAELTGAEESHINVKWSDAT